jgi:hypothetical protein
LSPWPPSRACAYHSGGPGFSPSHWAPKCGFPKLWVQAQLIFCVCCVSCLPLLPHTMASSEKTELSCNCICVNTKGRFREQYPRVLALVIFQWKGDGDRARRVIKMELSSFTL